MLGFTHQSKNTGTKFNFNQPSFQPIIITNRLPKEVSPSRQQKVIKKATQHKNFTGQNWKQRPQKSSSKSRQQNVNKNDWNTGGITKGAFDKNLKKTQIATEQRRLRAEMKKQKQLIHQQIVINEKQIGTKSLKMMKQKDQQIEYLREMIEKEKSQKVKIDRLYEQKKQQIERQRQELIELERRIQKQGIKQKKIIQDIKKIASPQKDHKPFARSNANTANYNLKDRQSRVPPVNGFQEPTQSETLHSKNVLRQKQLEYLINQRQKCISGLPNINYSPTLIPLLSKASYKIVSTHVSQIVELLVDDLLQEQVYLLEQIQLQEAKQREQQKSKNMLNEYYDVISGFVQENEEISNKVGKYSSMNFADVYKPKHYPESNKKAGFSYDNPIQPIVRKISLEAVFDEDRMEQVQSRKQRFVRFVSNFDEYKKANVAMFQKCTQEMIDQAIEKLAKQLDKGSGQFVDIVFRNQFN